MLLDTGDTANLACSEWIQRRNNIPKSTESLQQKLILRLRGSNLGALEQRRFVLLLMLRRELRKFIRFREKELWGRWKENWMSPTLAYTKGNWVWRYRWKPM